MTVGLAVRQRGATTQPAQPWAGLRTVWVRVWGPQALPLWAPRVVERAEDEAPAWADTQPAMFWSDVHSAPDAGTTSAGPAHTRR